MSTNKPRIQAYIESSLHQKFEQDREAWGLSQSGALERILLERYQSNITGEAASDRDLTPLINSIHELRLQVSNLEDELEDRLLGKLESKLLGNSQSNSSDLPKGKGSLKEKWEREVTKKYAWEDGYCRLKLHNGSIFVGLICSVSDRGKMCKIFDSLTDTQLHVEVDRLILPGELESELVTSESELVTSESELVTSESELVTSESELVTSESELVTSELPSELSKELASEAAKGFSQRSLARRFGVSHPYIGKLQKEGELESFSKEADPDGLAWEFREGKYYPIMPLPIS